MSLKVMNWVWANSTEQGTGLLLLLAIADTAHDDGKGSYPSIETLAQKSRVSQRAVQYQLRRLEESRTIIIEYHEGPHGANLYSVIMSRGANVAPGVQTDAESAGVSKDGTNLAPVQVGAEGVQVDVNRGASRRRRGAIAVAPKPPENPLREPPEEPPDKSKISQNSQNQENSENSEDQSLWPKWYSLGYGVPGWKVSFADAEAWRVEAGIPEPLIEIKVYALRDWWARLPKDGKRATGGDPWMTLQNWCRRDREQWIANNGGGDGKPGVDTQEAGEDEWEREARRMREHRKAIRAEHGLPPEPDLVPNMPGVGVGLPPGPGGAP